MVWNSHKWCIAASSYGRGALAEAVAVDRHLPYDTCLVGGPEITALQFILKP